MSCHKLVVACFTVAYKNRAAHLIHKVQESFSFIFDLVLQWEADFFGVIFCWLSRARLIEMHRETLEITRAISSQLKP